MNKYSTIIGMDLGDKYNHVCFIDASSGDILQESKVACTEKALRLCFGQIPPAQIAIETGTHSPWVSRLLAELGHAVLVANARKVRAIYLHHKKCDQLDAQTLARIARVDPHLLSPIQHRAEEAQMDLAVLRARDAAVASRTKLINHVRGAVKSTGHRLPKCSAPSFHKQAAEALPEALHKALFPLLKQIEALTETIKEYDETVKALCDEKYPETEILRGVPGVGDITALCFVLTLEDPERFAKSRDVPAYFGLVPARNQSGNADPQLRITRAGDPTMRRLLVSAAQYILGKDRPDTELRRWGLKLAGEGSSRAKRRAVVAVARKLAVLLHTMWLNGTAYEHFPGAPAETEDQEEAEAAA